MTTTTISQFTTLMITRADANASRLMELFNNIEFSDDGSFNLLHGSEDDNFNVSKQGDENAEDVWMY